MNVLFVVYPDMSKKNGGSICTKAFIDIFSDIAENIKIVLPKSDTYAWDLPRNQIFEVPKSSFLKKITRFFWGAPHRYYDFLKTHEHLFQGIDIVVLSSGVLGYGIPSFVQALKIPIVTIHQNYEPLYHKDNKTLTSLGGIFTGKIYRGEDAAIKQSILNIALTSKDTELLSKNHHVDKDNTFIVCPVILDNNRSIPAIQTAVKNKIVITGALHDYQTEDGIQDYIDKYHQILLRYIPKAQVIIAGRNPSNKLIRRCEKTPSITIIANPVDIENIVKDANLFINPTRLGSGLKLRNMDAFLHGCPIIANKASSSGYEPMFGHGLWSYHDEKTFEKAIMLFQMSDLSRETIQNQFITEYSPLKYKRVILEKLSRFL